MSEVPLYLLHLERTAPYTRTGLHSDLVNNTLVDLIEKWF